MIFGFRTDRAGILVLATVLIVVLSLLFLLTTIWTKQSAYKSQASDLGPRIARVKGLVEHQDELREAVRLTDQYVMDLTYPPTGDSQTTSAAMQQQTRGLLEAAGMAVTGSQILPATRLESFEQIRVEITAQGSMESLERALLSLDGQQPLVLVESLNLQPVRARRRADPSQEVVARFRLVSLRLTP